MTKKSEGATDKAKKSPSKSVKKMEVKAVETDSVKETKKSSTAVVKKEFTKKTKKNSDSTKTVIPEKRIYVNDAINYNRDIKPYKVIEVVSGVGSGKNYWVKETLTKKHRVLEITSRRKTADAQADYLDADDSLAIKKVEAVEDAGLAGERDCVITTYQLMLYEKRWGRRKYCNKYGNVCDIPYLWELFDCIVLDEAHSLVADASYQDAPFYVHWFIMKAITESEKCKVILMTATPEPITYFNKQILNVVKKEKFNFIDLYDKKKKVHYVKTEDITFHPFEDIANKLEIDIKLFGNKVLFFTHTIDQMQAVYEAFNNEEIVMDGSIHYHKRIDDKRIGVDFADDRDEKQSNLTKAKAFLPNVILANRQRIRESLKPKFNDKGEQIGELIPEDIDIFITTGTNREGINIRNTDFQTVYILSENKCEITQILGRLRNGVRDARVVYNYPLNVQGDPHTALFYQQESIGCFPTINHLVEEARNPQPQVPREEGVRTIEKRGWWGNNSTRKVIDRIHDHYDYLRYDYYIDYFRLYKERFEEYRQRIHDKTELRYAILNFNSKMEVINGRIQIPTEFDGEVKPDDKSKERYDTDDYNNSRDVRDELDKISTMKTFEYNRTWEDIQEERKRREEQSEIDPNVIDATYTIIDDINEYSKESTIELEVSIIEPEHEEKDIVENITGGEFLKKYWFPDSNLYCEFDPYPDAIANLKLIDDAVRELLDPYKGEIIADAIKENLTWKYSHLAILAAGTRGLKSVLYSQLVKKKIGDRYQNVNIMNTGQIASIYRLYGYDLKNVTKHRTGAEKEWKITTCDPCEAIGKLRF